MKQQIKQILIRSTGLILATFFGGTAVGAVAGSWWMGSLIGVGSAFAVVLTMIGVSVTWSGELSDQSITNAFRAAVAKAAEDNEAIKKALDVEEDGEFDFDDLVDDNDLEEYQK
jgi:divalent metal cation (Fe/Co/Zn/Cd) transporter